MIRLLIIAAFGTLMATCKKDQTLPQGGTIQLAEVQAGSQSLLQTSTVVDLFDTLYLRFNVSLRSDALGTIRIQDENLAQLIEWTGTLTEQARWIAIKTKSPWIEGHRYRLIISSDLKGLQGETFQGLSLPFEIKKKPLELLYVRTDNKPISHLERNTEISLTPIIEFALSHPIDPAALQKEIVLVGRKNHSFTIEKKDSAIYTLRPSTPLPHFSKLNLLFPPTLGQSQARPFTTRSYTLYTGLDTSPKFPLITDDQLLDLVQSKTFQYFWEFGHPVSGLARERNTSGDLVTSGGSGFGIMATIVAVERKWIQPIEAVERWKKTIEFLARADRFHGAWSHWLSGSTGRVIPFSARDNGGDLVETAFLVQGLITLRQYLLAYMPDEKELIDKINALWQSVEWNWYSRGGQSVLYWHWSPNFNWDMNLAIRGHNETLIVYILAAAAPQHSIPAETYHKGYAQDGRLKNGSTYFGYTLPLGNGRGGPLFFSHYSFLGLDPRRLRDIYADYWLQNKNHSLIQVAYATANPQRFVGYSQSCWGLTASDNESGYAAHSPDNDRGVISPTAALSSFPYTPVESMRALKHFYFVLGDRLWGTYGFYDAFNPTADWVADSYLAIDQGPIICMIENHRTGLLWKLFMEAPEIQAGLTKLGFSYK
jgi:hypothetical protein